MSQSGTPRVSSASAWWLLLLLPAAGAIGWGIGLAPVSAPRETETVSTRAEDTRAAATRPGAPTDANRPGARAEAAPSPDPSPRVEISEWSTYAGALEASRLTGKPVLLDFNADWCGPCRKMKQQVFEDPELGRRIQTAVIPVSLSDRVREEGRNSDEVQSLMQRHRVEAFPTLVVFSPATGRSVETRGFGGAAYTAEWIEWASKSVR